MMKRIFVIISLIAGTTGFSQTSKTVSPKEKNELGSEKTVLDSVSVSSGTPTDKKNVSNQNQGTYPMKLSSGVKPNSAPQQKTAPVLTRTLSDIETEIESVENKKAYVDANPTLKAEAEADGSYQEMIDRLAYLQAEKQKHINK